MNKSDLILYVTITVS